MKINQASKISHLQLTEKTNEKVKSIQSLIKQFCSPQSADCDQLSPNLPQVVIQKKIVTNTSSDSSLKIQKYVKIKKNKRKQKKKLLSVPAQLQSQKNFTHDLCSCCSGKLDNALTHDDEYQSQDDCYVDDSSQINSIIQNIGQQILQQYYDKIDKAVSRIMVNKNKNNNEQQNTKIFLCVMKKLAEIYTGYYRELQEDITRQFEGETILIPLETSWSVPQQFKEYIITRFPLLKVHTQPIFEDFIENFKLADLNSNQMKQFKQLKLNNPLMEIISNHMEDMALKRNKKKNKRQLQKLNKQTLENYSKIGNYKVIEGSNDPQDIITRLQNIQIKQKQRINCYYDPQWLIKVKNQVKNGIK